MNCYSSSSSLEDVSGDEDGIDALTAQQVRLAIEEASVLVMVFPARRVREALVLLGVVVLVGVFVLIRLVRPERLVDAQSFESVQG